MAWFGDAKATSNDGKTWGDIKSLLRAVRGNARGATLFVHRDGDVWLSVKVDYGSEFTGNGPDPWSAARDLAEKCGSLKGAIDRALHDGAKPNDTVL